MTALAGAREGFGVAVAETMLTGVVAVAGFGGCEGMSEGDTTG